MSSQDYYQTPRIKDMGGFPRLLPTLCTKYINFQDYHQTFVQDIWIPKIVITLQYVTIT
jgi:hypothetical protein